MPVTVVIRFYSLTAAPPVLLVPPVTTPVPLAFYADAAGLDMMLRFYLLTWRRDALYASAGSTVGCPPEIRCAWLACAAPLYCDMIDVRECVL